MYQAGFARVEVTPPLGTKLTGYFALRTSDGVLDPIQLNAIAISNEEACVLVITGDFMYMRESDATYYRNKIAKELGLPVECVFIQAIHQHTSTTAGQNALCDPHYQYILERKYCDVAKMAMDDRKNATVRYAQKETAEPISFIRRFRMKDGSVATNPGRGNPNIDHPLGEADNTVRLVRFCREEGGDIALVNFATHPDVIGGTKFSADWPGFVRRMTEQDLPGVKCILVNGCQGDTNHINVSPGANTAKGYAHSRHMGRVITDTVLSIWDQGETVEVGPVTARYELRRIPSNTEGLSRVDECRKLLVQIQNKTLEKPMTMAEKGETRRIANMENVPLVQKVPVAMVAFGKIALIGYGGEPFTEYADKPRAAVSDLIVLSACLADGAQGYLPSAEAFAEGGYEARTTNFTPGVASDLQGAAIRFLREHLALLEK